MMNLALSAKLGTSFGGFDQQATAQAHAPETVEAEIVEPAESGGQK